MKIIFLTEEPSMAEFLKRILPKILPEEIHFQIVPHEGIGELKKSIPVKLHHWREAEDVRFMIVLDRDSHDCIALKEEIRALCRGTVHDFRIRIACQELEAWYFGDLAAVSEAYGKDVTKYARQKKYRIPDAIRDPKETLKRLLPEHRSQREGARRIGRAFRVERNTSESFLVFLAGVRTLAGLGGDPECEGRE